MPKKNYGRKFLSVLIVLVMLCTSVVGGHVKAANPGSTTVFDKNGLKVDFRVDSQWVGFINGTMTVTNTGTQPVEDWAITFDFPHEITNIWNAGIIEHQQGVYTVKNLEWNQDILVGGSISFGFTAAVSGNITYPTFFTVNTKTAVVPSALVKVEYVLYSDWGSGYSAALKITNLSQTKIEDWTIDFDFVRSISTLSCGKILAHDETHYTIQNDGSTQNLSTGQTIQLGLVGTGGIASNVPTGSIVKQIVRGFDLVSDTDGDLVLDWVEICVKGTDPLVPDGTTPTPTPTPSATPTPTPPEDMVTDTDGDLIPDYYEAVLGTDPTLADTDKDGLSDYDEIFLLGFNPLSTDSDGNGILDYDEDVDHDGLSFRQEAQAGTDSYNKDTDADGLLDGEEINTYGTNPLVADVDGDGLVDGDEIALSLDPTNPATHGVPDSEYTQTHSLTSDSAVLKDMNTEASPFTLSIDVNAAGNVAKNLTVTQSKYSTVMQNDAILGVIPELDYDDSYKTESVTLKFQIKDDYIANSNGQYAAVNPEYEGIKRYNVFRYFEDINMLLPVETHFDLANQTVYAETDAFGTYCIIDMEVWLDSIGILPEDVAVGTSQASSELTLNEVNTLGLNTVLEASTNSTPVDPSAEVKVERYNGHRYAVIDKSLSYLDAKAYCEYMAGHLVTITSQTEQDYINSFLLYGSKNMYWLGGEEHNGVVNWITGEKSTYTNWAVGEPSSEGEIYVHMYRNSYQNSVLGSWNDTVNYYNGTPFHSTDNSGLLCEWETPVNLVYGTSLKSCNSAIELSNISDQDWDNDGIPNWKEVNSSLNLGYWNANGVYIPASYANCLALKSSRPGMLDAFSRLNVNPLLISVIPLKSNPESADTDVDGYTDDIDLNPQIKAENNIVFGYSKTGWDSPENTPDFITLAAKREEDSATWCQHPELADDLSIAATYSEADTITNCIMGFCPHANATMDHYLDATGTDFTINPVELIMGSKYASDQYRLYLGELKDHVKSVLKDGDTLHIVSVNPFAAESKVFYPGTENFDWLLTLGAANGAFSIVASRTGDVYTMKGTYYVTDTYDFDKGDTNNIIPFLSISNGEMFNLHSAGMAQAYYVHGEMDISFTFKG